MQEISLSIAIKKLAASLGLEIKRSGPEQLRFNEKWWQERLGSISASQESSKKNSLEAFFDAHKEGPGIWKWRHYFEIYERHLSKFVNTECRILEIGVYSGGSLKMWKKYFGSKSRIYGVDIEPSCHAYAEGQVEIWIGDQADTKFWDKFVSSVGYLDVIIDDGGHKTCQQLETMKSLVPILRPGGVYICEDIVGEKNQFSDYICELSKWLNEFNVQQDYNNPERRVSAEPNAIQETIHSIHLYPLMAVIERRDSKCHLVAPKHGTVWEPHLA